MISIEEKIFQCNKLFYQTEIKLFQAKYQIIIGSMIKKN